MASFQAQDDSVLRSMISDFPNLFSYAVQEVNIREFPFDDDWSWMSGMRDRMTNGKYIYKDGFDEYLRSEIQTVDAIVYVF